MFRDVNPTDLRNDVWQKLECALNDVNAILDGTMTKPTSISTRMQWYTTLYNVATSQMNVAERLAKQLDFWINADLERRVTCGILSRVAHLDADALFHCITHAYADFKVAKRFATLIFSYVDTFLQNKERRDSVDRVYLKAFHRVVYTSVRPALRAAVLRQVDAWRDGNVISITELRSALSLFVEVGTCIGERPVDMEQIYKADFEDEYLAHTKAFYASRVAALLESDDSSHTSYVEWCEERFRLERIITREILKPTSETGVGRILTECLLEPYYEKAIGNSDIRNLLDNASTKSEGAVVRLYNLFSNVRPAIQYLAKSTVESLEEQFERHAARLTTGCNGDVPTSPEKFIIEWCLFAHSKYSRVLIDNTGNEKELVAAVRSAFQRIMNKAIAPPCERTDEDPQTQSHKSERLSWSGSVCDLLANYVDAVMKREMKDIVDPEAELERIDQLATLFTYLKEKDVFQEYHKAKLAKRLLQTTPNEELERAFIEKLQRVMGKGYTHKMEGMLRDRESTREMSDKFRAESAARNRRLPVDLTCQVLSAGHWPAYRSDSTIPTRTLRHALDTFTRFYKRSFATRTLSWIHMLGSATLSIAFPKGVKDVTCSIHQAAILVLIDEAGKMSGRDLANATKMDWQKVLVAQIQSLHSSRTFAMLLRVNTLGESGQPHIIEEDTFALNESFQYKTRRFRLPAPSSAASAGLPSDGDIDQLRKVQIDACIVRVMKARRVLPFNELTQLVIDQLSKLFEAQQRHVKVRTEDLLSRGYLKRDPNDSSIFQYVA